MRITATLGPTWSAFFYEKGGGSLPDLGVYNLATLTGLLGPAKAVIGDDEHRHARAHRGQQGTNQGRGGGQRHGR